MNTIKYTSLIRFVSISLAVGTLNQSLAHAQTMQSSSSAPAEHTHTGSRASRDRNAGSGPGSEKLSQAVNAGLQSMQEMKVSGDVDKDFATMMKMHHKQALDMAKVEITQGKSAELKRMAEKMIQNQSKEIERLDHWLKNAP